MNDAPADRRTLVIRGALGALAFTGVVVGAWAAFLPDSFYNDFPGFGRAWVGVDGPFNEHLVRDVGQLFLALAVVTATAAVFPIVVFVRAVGAAWLVEGLPHLVYHAANAGLYDTVDAVLNLASLSMLVVLALIVLLTPQRGPAARTIVTT